MRLCQDCGDCEDEGRPRCICYDLPSLTPEERDRAEIQSLRDALADPGGHPEDRAAWRHELSILTRPESWN